jgi:transcriptional regulator with GAF, ATPase, and Fis domain
MSLTALACGVPVLVFRSPLARLLPVGILLVVAGLSFLLFAGVMWNIPLVPLLVAGSIAGASGYVYRQSVMAKNMGVLQHERDRIAASLREKEKKVLQLEDELLRNGSDRQNDRTAELLEEIRKYKAEVHTLAARADDLEVFTTTESDSSSSPANFEGILHSPAGAMKSVVEFVGKIAKSSAPVLILGESGTGKELVARAIHNRSTRAGKAFVAINCGALSESLLESELFGHDKGAFTGAVKDRLGRFELADGGTLFLDEIGEVSESFQVKLLRVLQQGEFEHVGGSRTLKVDTRVVAATNKDLRTLVEQKGFREDLFYRLNVLTVSLPALRDRQEDIPLLAHHFLRREENSMQMSRVVMDALQAHPWRGNVRELESAMMRAVLLAKSDGRTMVSLKDLPEGIAASVSGKTAIDERIMDMLREKGFSRSAVSETAEELGGLNRGTVAEYLRGQSLKIFCEQQFNPEASASHISLSTNPDILGRVDKRLREYLLNISTVVHSDLPWDDVRAALRSKTKNLPQRYHVYVEEIARAFHDGTLQPDPHS